MTTIVTDVEDNVEFDATNAFLEKWKDADDNQPSDETAEGAEDDNEDETPEENVDPSKETDEEENEDDEEVLEDPDEEGEVEEVKVASDNDEVIIKVNDTEQKVSVKELKRLFGQEAALTRKSQETAEERKTVEAEKARYSTALQTMQKRAEDKYRPYSEIDFLVASRQLDADEFEALRKEALAAYEDYKFYTEELKNFKDSSEQDTHKEYLEKAQKAIQVLSDPTEGIPGWSKDLYDEIRTFAVEKNGMDMDAVNKITDPSIIKMMWKAMRYDKAKKVSTKKIAKAPKKVVKPATPADTKAAKTADDKAFKRLRETGSPDDAVTALMNRWADED